MMPSTLHHAVALSVAEEVKGDSRFKAEDVALRVERDYSKLVSKEAPNLVHQYIKRIAKDELRRQFQNDNEQPALPGLKFPLAIAVREDEGEVQYVPSRIATWADLRAGLAERERHITSTTVKRDQFSASMDVLRPVMEKNADMTVQEALRLVGRAALAPQLANK